ncbi:MAG: phage integrase SAM-like domain-containing protein [Bacteriovoracia bacterium]
MTPSHKPLPGPAEKFLEQLALVRKPGTLSFTRTSIHHLHRFLLQQNLELRHLTPDVLKKFDTDLEMHRLNAVSRKTVFQNIRRYLICLSEADLFEESQIKVLFPHFDPEQRRTLAAKLPEVADQFLTTLKPIYKPSTISGYRTAQVRNVLTFSFRRN